MELETQMLSQQVQSWVSRGPDCLTLHTSCGCLPPCVPLPGGRKPSLSDYSEQLLFTQQLYSELTGAIIGVFLILTITMGHVLSSFLKYKWLFTLHHLSKKIPV